MKTEIWAILVFCLLSLSLYSQERCDIKGLVTDTAVNVNLLNSSISVLSAKDSMLVAFTRAKADGSFSISDLQPGKYLLLVTYPKYADYMDRFTLDSAKRSVDFGKIGMILKSTLLADVIVKGQVAAIKIKGDTTEYNAGSFVVAPNSKVEDLLKQLPGIQVDKDGKITAQGETVNKVLVDGEEFFGDDPTLVTKNLRADMVDKVQLYDKKSDQATFTGIDDGVKTKTLDIKLKQDKKKGYFGKVDGGGANDGFYSGQGMFNAFRAKEKIAAYGTVANTGKTGLNWEDSNKYGAGGVQVSDEGYFMIERSDDLRYNGQGIPEAKTGGLHYDGKWNKDRQSINANYKAGELSIDGVRNNLTQTTLPKKTEDGRDSIALFGHLGSQRFENYTWRQKLDATYQLKIDSSSNLKVIVSGSQESSRSSNIHNAQNFRGNNIRQNISDRDVDDNGNRQSFYANLFYNKKLKKTGRTFSVNLTQSLNKGNNDGFLYTRTQYFDEQGEYKADSVIDQLKTTDSRGFAFSSNVTYTEPITKTFSAILNYGLTVNNSNSDRRSLNKALSGNYENLDLLYSNNFEYDQLSHQAGLIFNYKKKKSIVNFGAKLSQVDLSQIDHYSSIRFDRSFTNLNPQASYEYRFSQYRSFRAGFNGSTRQPSINEIQPVRVNSDPLNIYLGNADLKPSFTNSFNINYRSYKVLSNQYIYLGAYFSFDINDIVSSTVTDLATGGSTHASVNLNDKMSSNYNIYVNFNRKVKALGLNVGLNVSTNGNRSFNYINNLLNTLQSNGYNCGLNVSKYVAKKYDFWLYAGPSYNTNSTTVKSLASNNGSGGNSRGSFSVYLPHRWEIKSDYEYTLTGKTEAFNQSVDYMIWNSSISKKFRKDEGLKLSLSAHDILNQNTGFRRTASGTSITQNSYNTIRRYFMLSLIWDFNKMGGGLKPKEQ